MLTRLGGVLYRARWGVLLSTILLTIIMSWYGLGVFDSLASANQGDTTSESVRAKNLIDDTLGSKANQKDSIILVLSNTKLLATDPEFSNAAQVLFEKIYSRSEVDSITSFYSNQDQNYLSRDQHEALVVVAISTKEGASQTYNNLVPYFNSPILHIDIGGALATNEQFNDQLRSDLESAELVSLPIVALLLVVVFGGLIAAMLPLLVGGFAIVGSFTLLRILTLFMDVSNFATNVVTIIGLGLAIDYSLFIITRFREELAYDPDDVEGAIKRAMATAGRTVLFSGLTVCTSLLSLLIFTEPELRSIGLATIASALVAMLGAITVLPTLLILLGRNVNALSIQRLWRRKNQGTAQRQENGAWYKLSYFVMRWRAPIAVSIIVFLLLLGTPFLHAAFAATDDRSLPLDSSSRAVNDDLQNNFVNQNNATVTIAITTHGKVLSDDNLTRLNSYVADLKKIKKVTTVSSVVTLNDQLSLNDYKQIYAHPDALPGGTQLLDGAKQLEKNNVTEVLLTSSYTLHDDAVSNLVTSVRQTHAPAGFSILVGGAKAEAMDQAANLDNALPYAIIVMVAAIFLLLFLMTGSIVMPLKAILLNVLSLSATLGALVWIFQDGHLQTLFHFKSFGYLDETQPILIFAIAFGLSMDYEVFLLSRIKEQFDKTGNNREAVAIGLQRTGALITSAALLLAVVVSAFAFAHIIVVQEIGVGIALAVLMDATFVRTLLVPSMMALLGKANWWAPRPLKTLWGYIGLREHVEAPTGAPATVTDAEQPATIPTGATIAPAAVASTTVTTENAPSTTATAVDETTPAEANSDNEKAPAESASADTAIPPVSADATPSAVATTSAAEAAPAEIASDNEAAPAEVATTSDEIASTEAISDDETTPAEVATTSDEIASTEAISDDETTPAEVAPR